MNPPSKKILLIEDDSALRAVILKFLGVQNEMHSVGTLEEARALIRETEFDVILLDKGLPDGDGISIIPEIKAVQPCTTIIMITADTELNFVTKSLSVGADDYVIKTDNLIPELFVRIPVAMHHASLKRMHCIPAVNLPEKKSDLSPESYSEFVKEAEKTYLSETMRVCNGDVNETATLLGLGRSTVFKKMAELGISSKPWKGKAGESRQSVEAPQTDLRRSL